MLVPNRARSHQPHASARGPMSLTCPACAAAPAWSCVDVSYDDDGNPYVRRSRKTPHPERRQAWRDR